jgi:hypothetical protein
MACLMLKSFKLHGVLMKKNLALSIILTSTLALSSEEFEKEKISGIGKTCGSAGVQAVENCRILNWKKENYGRVVSTRAIYLNENLSGDHSNCTVTLSCEADVRAD